MQAWSRRRFRREIGWLPYGHAHHPFLAVIQQARFHAYLELAESFLSNCVEQGTVDMLPVVRMVFICKLFGAC